MPSDIRTFAATPLEAVTMANTFIAPRWPFRYGMNMGRCLFTHRNTPIDPWLAQGENTIDATTTLITGMRNSGKTTLAKSLMARFSCRQGGADDGGEPDPFMGRIDDRKKDAGRAEYYPLTEALGGTVVDLSTAGRLNIFDGLEIFDIIEVAAIACEIAAKRDLQRYEPLAIQAGVYKMLKDKAGVPRPEILERIVLRLTMEDLYEYFANKHRDILEEYRNRQEADAEAEDLLGLTSRVPHNIPAADFLRDAGQVATLLGEITGGLFGHVFGGTGSLTEWERLNVVTFQWAGVNQQAQTLLGEVMARRDEMTDDNLRPQLHVTDEGHEAFDNPRTVKTLSGKLRKARESRTWRVMVTQFADDHTMAGEADSSIRNTLRGIQKSYAFHIVGLQPNREDVKHALVADLGMSDLDAELCTRLPQGCFAAVIPNSRDGASFFQHLLLPGEIPLVQTNSASARMNNFVSAQAYIVQRKAEDERAREFRDVLGDFGVRADLN